MRRTILYLSVIFLIINIIPNKLTASHIIGAFITYTSLDTNQYILSVHIYRDCRNSNSAQPNITVNYESSCAVSDSIALPLITGDMTGNPGTGIFIPPMCLGVTTCLVGQQMYAVEEFIYEDTIIFPSACTDWIISFETVGLRSYNDVLVNATNQKLYVSALINNVDAPLNNSPAFDSPPITSFCVGRIIYFDHSAIDSDADSLFYSLAPAQGVNGDTLAYIPPYTYQSPLDDGTPPNGFGFDSVNGIIYFSPSDTITSSVICVLIKEYRNNTLIGSIKTDIQSIVSDSCLTDTINFVGDTTTPTGNNPAISVNCLDNTIAVYFDNPIRCLTVAGNGTDFIVMDPVGQTISVSAVTIINCINELTDTIILHLSDSLRLNGSYFISDKVGSDGNSILSVCGLPLSDTLEVRVMNCVTGVSDLRTESVSLNKISPNPASDKIFIKSNFDAPALFELYDITGRKVLEQTITGINSHINVSHLSKGFYICKLATEKTGSFTGKIIKH